MKIRPEIHPRCPRYSRQRQESVTVGINSTTVKTEQHFYFSLPLTIPVQDGRAAGAEWWPSLQVPLILPLLLLLVGRLVHHFDLMLQHGEATDRHSDGAKRARHLHRFSKGNIPVGWSVRGESVYCRSTSCVLSQLVLCHLPCHFVSILHCMQTDSQLRILAYTVKILQIIIIIIPLPTLADLGQA